MGADLVTATADMASMVRVTTRSRCPMIASVPYASTMATTQMTGSGASMRKLMTSVCWTTFASESVRVIMEPVPSWENSKLVSERDFS